MTKAGPVQWTTRLGALTGHPAAFLIVIGYGVLWFSFSRATFDWVAVATLAIWCMTLFIQRADRRDTLAVHAKLDELLKVTREARTELAQIDEEEPEAIERIRDRERRDAMAEEGHRGRIGVTQQVVQKGS
jgi:low affinity Fe/Cu permease